MLRAGDVPTGLRVFIVEDESLVAMQLEDILADFGCNVVGLAMKLKRAMEMLAPALEIDLAILDVNIGGERVYPVAEIFRERQIPIVFTTGYGRAGVEERWHDCPILQKPYTEEDVALQIATALGQGADREPRTPAGH